MQCSVYLRTNKKGLTECNHVQDKHNETQDAAAGSVLPSVAVAGGRERLLRDGRGVREEGQPQLGDEDIEDGEGEHFVLFFFVFLFFLVGWCLRIEFVCLLGFVVPLLKQRTRRE